MKNLKNYNMKQILFFLVASLPFFCQAQLGYSTVYDPTNHAALTAISTSISKDAVEAGKTTVQITEAAKTLKQSVSLYTKVSNGLKNAVLVKQVLEGQINLVNTCSKTIAIIRQAKGNNSSLVNATISHINNIISTNSANIDLVKKLLIDNGLAGNDTEKIKLLKDMMEESDKAVTASSNALSDFNAKNQSLNYLKSFSKK